MKRTVFFTIVARNYLSFATVLANSILEHHPEAEMSIWLLDDGDYPKMGCNAKYRHAHEAFTSDEYDSLRIYYDILELATAIKPRLIQKQLAEGADQVIYIDPDIVVFRPMIEVFSLLDSGASAVLTPHITQPLPRDGQKPDDLEILTSGIYNLGFLAVAACPEVFDFLSWWGRWLETHCIADKSQGVFTDQKWVEFAPSFMRNAKILYDPSYNIAYWNLHYRELRQEPDGWTVNGHNLCFYHFSGFNPLKPNILSKHQNRIEVSKGPVAMILKWYAEKLLAANYETTQKIIFKGPQFSNNVKVDIGVQSLFRKLTINKKTFIDPLSCDGLFYKFLISPIHLLDSSEENFITNYHKEIYNLRPDVRQAFPQLLGKHKKDFLKWLHDAGCLEMSLAKPLVFYRNPAFKKEVQELSFEPLPETRIINYVGYLGARLGLGEAARGNVLALHTQKISTNNVDVSFLTSSEVGECGFENNKNKSNFDNSKINIIHINADQLKNVLSLTGFDFLNYRYNIGFWAWETLKFPEEWLDRFAFLDEIWVGGSFMGKSVAEVSPLPVIHIPHVVQVPKVQPDRERFGIATEETAFLCMFDFYSTVARKNPDAVIKAFRKAFHPQEPVRLFVKSMNGASRPDEFAYLKNLAEGLNVTFMDQALSGEDRYRLIESCDVFVSLHRAEGFGLCLAEAMAMGKPVIATGWSGNMDFMDINNSLPVCFELKELMEDSLPYRAGTLWAEADTNHAAELMRKIWQEPDLAKKLGSRAKLDIETNFNATVVGKKMADRIEIISKNKPKERWAIVEANQAITDLTKNIYMDVRYKLFKKYRRGQITWNNFIENVGGRKEIAIFSMKLPAYLLIRMGKRLKASFYKRISKLKNSRMAGRG